MTNQTDIDALIAKNAAFRDATEEYELPPSGSIIGLWMATASALESTVAELRQERERADAAERALRATDDYRVADWQKLELERDTAEAELARAQEVIEKAREALARALYDIDPLPLHRGEGDEERIVGPKPWEWLGESYHERLRTQADAILDRFHVTPKEEQ